LALQAAAIRWLLGVPDKIAIRNLICAAQLTLRAR
jgi:hypothetical protein